MTASPHDLAFRPDYLSPADALSAILLNVKGQRRRELIRDIASGRARSAILAATANPTLADCLAEVEPGLLASSLESPASLAWINPTFMGGEYLPDYLPGEVEVARISMNTTTLDVVSVRARRRARGWVFRVVDEYRSGFVFRPRTAGRPLTLGQMADAMLSLEYTDAEADPAGGRGLIFTALGYQLDGGDSPEEAREFLWVESDLYPALADVLDPRIEAWIARRQCILG